MKKITLCLLAVAALLVSCSKDKGTVSESETESEKETPLVKDPEFGVKQDVKILVDPGQRVTFAVYTNISPDDWDCTTTPEGLVQLSKDSSSVVFAVGDDLDFNDDRKITVNFTCPRYPDCGASATVTIKKALAVDVGFNADGTASDLSSCSAVINTCSGSNLVTYFNEEADVYAARFSNPLGSAVTDSYYKISYSSNTNLKKALEDGHSFEVQFMLSAANNCKAEVSVFSARQAGGTGIILTDSASGRDIAFTPNVSQKGGSRWCSARSGVVPEVGKYYHVVGVWNKTEGKSYVYVNGELKGSADAKGDLVLPSSSSLWWIGIGADTAADGAEAAWAGDIVHARVFDAALSETAVKALWNDADKDFKAQDILLSDILYFPDGKVNIGSELPFCAEGLEEGDRIVMSGEQTYICETTYKTGKLVYKIPEDFKSGDYLLNILRGELQAPAGRVSFTLTEEPVIRKAPGLIAHRGAWNEYDLPQNSIASLAKAQELGCFASEMDIWITTDSVIYVNHDGVIDGKTIQTSTSAEMETVKLSNGETIPTFQDYLDQLKKNSYTKLSIEIKDHSDQQREFLCTDEAVRILRENGLLRQVEWNSFDWDSCLRVIEDDPGAVVYYQMPDTKLSLDLMHEKGFLGADYDYDDLIVNQEVIEKAHNLGIFIVGGGVHSESYYVHCVGLGVEQISTNIPGKFTEFARRLFD